MKPSRSLNLACAAVLFTLPLTLSVAVSPAFGEASSGKTASAAPIPYEEPPVLKASQILRPEILRGPHHSVREPVPTYSGANRYIIDSDFGVFEAEGNALLQQRVKEIGAIAKLREISRTDEFKNAVVAAAKSPVGLAKDLAKDPVGTVSGVPKGVWKFLNRAGQGVKEAAEGRKHSPYEDNAAKNLIGVSKAKRELAAQMGVDPYSSNETFQRELNGIAWTSVAGSTTVKALTMGVAKGAETAVRSVSLAKQTNDALRDSAPADLRRDNLAKLIKMGVPKATGEILLANPAFSPWHQTYLVTALGELAGVKGRADFVRFAAQNAEDEHDAIFFEQTAQLMSTLHRGGVKLDSIAIVGGLPVCTAADGTTVIALEWDYAAWTPMAGRFADRLKEFRAEGDKAQGCLLALTGEVSPRLRRELETRGVKVRDRLEPGPIR